MDIKFVPITPKTLKIGKITSRLMDAINAEGSAQKRELEKTVTTWKNKPGFDYDVALYRDDVVLETYPTGNDDAVNHWHWIDKGTRPHFITARKAPTLRFRTGYRAKTRVNQFTSGKSQRYGDWITPRSVRNPGIRARGWTPKLQKQRQKPFAQSMSRAMYEGTRKVFG